MTGSSTPDPEKQPGPAPPPRLSDDRRAALQAGRTPVPRRFVMVVVIVFVVLGLGGVVLERVIGTPGATNVIPSPPTTIATIPTSSPYAILGLSRLDRPAPSFVLTDQRGQPWSLGQARGRVVILAFYNRDCNDICPVLGSELAITLGLLGSHANQVDVAIVNTDPTAASIVRDPLALSVPKLASRANVIFLNGSLAALNSVWTHYGVEVRVASAPAPVIHSDELYVIDSRGVLRDLITPFANESRAGVESLSAATRLHFGAALAEVAGSLLR